MADLRIGIVSVYFGKMPEYFPVWAESCRRNPTIDFIFVTDQKVSCDVTNVTIVQSSLQEFKARAEKALGFDITLDVPFKLCDYKPAYGVILKDLLVRYDYWGYCDIDLIWGDLRSFFDRYQLCCYDKFLPLGHLCLYRNTAENNCRFMEHVEGLSDYIKIYQTEQNFLFDELALNRIYQDRYPFFNKIIFADIWPWKRRYTMCTSLKYYPSIYEEFSKRCSPVNFSHQIFMWVDGKIYQYYLSGDKVGRREYIYIHIQKRKWKLLGDFSQNMVISQNSVIPVAPDELNIPNLIARYNPYNALADLFDDVCEFVQHCWSYFKRRVIKVEKSRVVVEK